MYNKASGQMFNNRAENRELLQYQDRCDKYDYLIAVACGAIGGMIDIFLVGAPGDSTLCNWTDAQVDKAVMGFAKKMGWNPSQKNLNNVNSAIGFLERGKNNGKVGEFQGFKVNYDQRKPSDVGNLFNIAPKTHHMMSLAHSPDVVGLFFSILNQFTSTSSFIADGKLVTIATNTFELRGGNFLMKIMCGIANWFGHIMSDIAGSSGAHGRGTGVVMPFYEFFGFCKFGNFKTQDGVKDLSEIAMKAFTEGYDFRFGMAQAIPVIVTELSIRLVWAIRRRFQFHKPLKECIPTQKHADLRVMLLFGNGTLCVMDGVDAGIRSGGNFLMFFMRMNLVAWFRFATLVLKEICIRTGLAHSLEMELEALTRMNEAVKLYLRELERIDIDLYKHETEQYHILVSELEDIHSDEDLRGWLISSFDVLGIDKPWTGDFDEFMGNPNNRLVFK